MPRKHKTTTTLIIVESPAKCKKIEECLGGGYKCVATYGHLRTIPSLQHIQIDNGFTPMYTLIDNDYKTRQLEVLRREIKQADAVLLASDVDREGEMISYSIIELFGLPLNTPRIVFTEITESALRRAVQNPRTVDMNLVRAQQARQILDVLVGFKVTPSLWKALAPPKGKEHTLSAGRCQTPALKLVYENHLAILGATERKVYKVTGYFGSQSLPFNLNTTLEEESEVVSFLEESVDFEHMYTCSAPSRVTKAPPEPLTTSHLQQVASNELRWSPKETMSIAQKLYEGGYITYMRTDSKTYSQEFLDTVEVYLERTYNTPTLFNPSIRDAKNDDDHAQEAHEAIRPTHLSLQALPEDADKKEKKLYQLIWRTTLESCMVPAIYSKIVANVSAPCARHYTYVSELVVELGWQRIGGKSENDAHYQYLATLTQGTVLSYSSIKSKATVEGGKSHYTEARLVQLLKDKGIGRPSTYASLVDKIQERGYVKKETLEGRKVLCREHTLTKGSIVQEQVVERTFGQEKDKLVIQPLGILVMEYLNSHFASLFEYDYTSHMEESLDAIARGAMEWVQLCAQCNASVDALLEGTQRNERLQIALDDTHTFLIGKYGPVVKCVEQNEAGKEVTTFKKVRADLDVQTLTQEGSAPSLEDVIDISQNSTKAPTQIVLGTFEDSNLVLKKGKFGLYVQWKGGTQSRALKELGNRPMESIKLDEVLALLAQGTSMLREIGKHASVRRGAKGNYLFYKTPKMKKPQFMDIKAFPHGDIVTCPEHVAKAWIEVTYQVKL